MEQFLSDFHAPSINKVDAQRVLSNEILKNLYQGEVETNGRGTTQKYSNDTSGAEIRTLRQLPLSQEARELGASLNGGNFNGDGVETVATEAVGLRVLTVIDKPIDIAQVTMDMIPVDLLAGSIKNLSGLITRNINAMTIAGKLIKTLSSGEEIITVDHTSKETIRQSYISAATRLDLGDAEHAIDVFPEEGRVYVIRPEYKDKLVESAMFTLADSAQKMLAKGQMSPGDEPTKLANGYIGDLFGVPAHYAAVLAWKTAARYAGLPADEFEKVVGYCTSDMANSRAVAISAMTKVIDNPNGQGIRIQPLVRMGFESWYSAGNVILADTGFKNPFKFLKSLDSNYVAVNKGPASRMFANPTIAVDGTTVTPTDGVTYVGAKHFYVWTKDLTCKPTVGNFATAYEAPGAVKGTYTPGTAVALPSAAGSYCLMTLTLASDGTASVTKSTKVAKA